MVKEFLDFAYSLEGQTILAKYGSLPVRGDIAKEALKDLDPRYQVAAEAMAKGRTPYSVVFNDLINSANGPWTQMVNEVFFGDDVDGAIANAQETMQSIIDLAQQIIAPPNWPPSVTRSGQPFPVVRFRAGAPDMSADMAQIHLHHQSRTPARPAPTAGNGSACSTSRRPWRWSSSSSSCRSA